MVNVCLQFQIQFPQKLFFFEFGNPKVTVHKGAETIQGRKLFKGGNYMRKYGILKFGWTMIDVEKPVTQ